MKSKGMFWVGKIPLILLIPYLAVIGINGRGAALSTKVVNVEMCLPILLGQQIDQEKEMETIKVQAVIARTNMYRKLKEGNNLYNILKEERKDFNWRKNGSLDTKNTKVLKEATVATKDIILAWNGELKQIPYHKSNGGKTRNGKEVFRSQEYAYLTSVDSSMDKKAPGYLHKTYIAETQMPTKFFIEERDSAGYIQSIRVNSDILEGEAFRRGMNLASSNFTVQKIGTQYRFLCKGEGHGLGFSQYGGNVLAKQGKNFREILEYYFPRMEVLDIADIETAEMAE